MRSLTLLSALLLTSLSFGRGLSIGDSSPTMKVETMLKGEAVDLSKGIHVVEFWATWCGPCKMNIPHLTEMAHKYKGKVDVTGVDVWEHGDDKIGQAKKFVTTMGDKMDYNIAFDGDAKAMDEGFMTAANQHGIPTAFLIKDGQILDIEVGYPMDGLGKAIDEVLAGTYDVAAAKAKFDKQAAEEAEYMKKQAETAKLYKPMSDAIRGKNYPVALAEIDKLEAAHPEMKPQLLETRFNVLVMSGSPKVGEAAKAILAGPYAKNAEALNSFAWSIVDPTAKVPNPDYKAALVLGEAAAKASDMKDGSILDTYALTLFKSGDKAKALEIQTKAVDLYKASKDADAATVKEMEGRLDEYKKASA